MSETVYIVKTHLLEHYCTRNINQTQFRLGLHPYTVSNAVRKMLNFLKFCTRNFLVNAEYILYVHSSNVYQHVLTVVNRRTYSISNYFYLAKKFVRMDAEILFTTT